MKHYYFISILFLFFFTACEWKLKPNADEEEVASVKVQRFDRMEALYLTTGDYPALQQMETNYPMETRTLIENILKLGSVDSPEINNKFLSFFQDSTLQVIISEAESQYAQMDDVNQEFQKAFTWLKKEMPNLSIPLLYTQITSLDQSIVVGDGIVGISLDKYLGEDFSVYKREKYGFTPEQRKTMSREYIVPDCLSFYLLSVFPMRNFETSTQMERDLHMGKVMWVVNRALGKPFFDTKYISMVDRYMRKNPTVTTGTLLYNDNYDEMMK